MPQRDDYTLSIEDVAKRLNKSIRTIHRYKDSGRLSFVVGSSQGNPLFFSRSEVDALVRELYPSLVPAPAVRPVDPPDTHFWQRLERIERMLSLLEKNPAFEQLISHVGEVAPSTRPHIQQMLGDLLRLENGGETVDKKALGRLLTRLGTLLMED